MALKADVFDVGETLVDEERWWRRLADREGLVAAQTPQAFLAPSLRKAFASQISAATDCASLVERSGGRVAVVESWL